MFQKSALNKLNPALFSHYESNSLLRLRSFLLSWLCNILPHHPPSFLSIPFIHTLILLTIIIYVIIFIYALKLQSLCSVRVRHDLVTKATMTMLKNIFKFFIS